MKYPFVTVTWRDAHGPTDEFVPASSVKFEFAEVETSGYLLCDEKDGVVVAQSVTKDDLVRGNMHILRANIVRIRKVKCPAR